MTPSYTKIQNTLNSKQDFVSELPPNYYDGFADYFIAKLENRESRPEKNPPPKETRKEAKNSLGTLVQTLYSKGIGFFSNLCKKNNPAAKKSALTSQIDQNSTPEKSIHQMEQFTVIP